MHRQTPNSSALRTNSSSTIATVDKVDDNSLEQSAHVRMSSGEERDGCEAGQNYGFSSHNMPADKGQDGKIEASSETTMTGAGSSRAHQQAGALGDRRHRTRGLTPGNVCVSRTNKDSMQMELDPSGMFHSAPQQVRMQLVPSDSGKANPPQSKAKATQAKRDAYARHTPHIEARLWAGLEPDLQQQIYDELDALDTRAGRAAGTSSGGSAASGNGKPGDDKKTGQKSVKDAGQDSPDFLHVKKGEARMSSAKKTRLSSGKDDGDTLHETSGGIDYCGGTPDVHNFSIVLTLGGPCKNVKGRIA